MRNFTSGFSPHLWAVLACALTTLLTQPLLGRVDLANIVMLFLLTVVVIAVKLGRKPAITASFVSIALFDFFFVPPRFSFNVNDVEYFITFAVMLVVALLISHLTTGLRQSALEAGQREQQTRALYALAQRLAGAVTVEQVVLETQQFLRETLQHELRVLLPSSQEILLPLAGTTIHLNAAEALMVHSIFAHPQTVELGSDNPPTLIVPLVGVTRPRGVMLVSAQALQRPLIEAVASLMATALDRLHFVEVAQQQKMQIVTERLRSSILAALSHDIRTPLTVLYGLADTLALPQHALPDPLRETASALRDQAMRLNNMVNNLLDMARLHSGLVQLHKEWQPIEEVIGASLKLSGAALQAHRLKVQLADNLPLLEFDAVLLERVFCNLLENAAKYAPPHSDIVLRVAQDEGVARISLCNAGSGFPPDKLQQVFEPFERGTTEHGGVGMGLAICRAVVEAHGGEIAAHNLDAGGACVTFTLPLGTPPVIEPEEGV